MQALSIIVRTGGELCEGFGAQTRRKIDIMRFKRESDFMAFSDEAKFNERVRVARSGIAADDSASPEILLKIKKTNLTRNAP